MKVRILKSPYYCVKKGEVGMVTAIKFKGTRNEVWRVETKTESRLFRPGELRELR